MLAERPELVLLRPADTAQRRDVLSRLTHRDVDVRHLAVFARVVPWRGATGGTGRSAPSCLVVARVMSARHAVGLSVAVAGDGLDSGGQEHMTFARTDGMEGHPGRLEAGRAIALDGCSGHGIQSELHREHPCQAIPLFTRGLGAPEQHVVDLGRVELRYLAKRGPSHL